MRGNQRSAGELKNFYRGEYVAKYLDKPISRLRRLLPYINLSRSDEVADFACGSGMLLELIHGKIAHYWGVDFSEEFIEVAKREALRKDLGGASFECAEIVDFCSKHQGYFDKAFALDFSEHIYDDNFINIFSAVFRSLKEGGRLYIHTPNGDYFLEILKKKGFLKQFTEHVAVRNAGAYVKLLREVGFTSVNVHFLAHYVRPLSYLHFLSHIPLAGRIFQARLFIECRR